MSNGSIINNNVSVRRGIFLSYRSDTGVTHTLVSITFLGFSYHRNVETLKYNGDDDTFSYKFIKI